MAKILLVEDDNNLREIYEARLQAEGYEIVSAKDGEEALVIAKKEQPDLVIADVMMPRVSGFEMLDILRNTEGLKEVHVIMLTALGQAEDKTRADSLGADRYLVKSQVTLEDIVKAASDVLAGAPAGVAAGTADGVAQAPQQPAPAAGSPAPAPSNQSTAPPAPQPAGDTAAQPTPPAAPNTPPTANIPVTVAPPDNNTAPQPPQNNSQPSNPAPEPSTSNDTQLADAVNSLVAGTEDDAGTSASAPAAATTQPAQQQGVVPTTPQAPPASGPPPQMQTTQPAVPSPSVPAPPAPAPAPPAQPSQQPQVQPPQPADNDTAGNDTVTPAGRKTIQPLSAGTVPAQPGLDELLAKEGHSMDEPPQQVQQAPPPQPYAGAPHPPGHVISPGNANPGAPGDPNSISL